MSDQFWLMTEQILSCTDVSIQALLEPYSCFAVSMAGLPLTG